MKRFISACAITVAAVGALVVLASRASADEWNERTYFTFSAPVALPGVVLPAGTYVFTHPDFANDRHLVQVRSADGQIQYGTFETVPEARPSATSEATLTLEERRAGRPEAIKAWFYPGLTLGDEFIYQHGRHGTSSADRRS